jgi:hypothetical protein
MASELDIYNDALVALGEDMISSTDEENKAGRLCRFQWPLVRDELIMAHPWNFAIRRASLTQDTTDPAFGYDNQFHLPTDPYCLRVIQMSEIDYEFKIEGRSLLTNMSTAKILYIARVDDYSSWSPLARVAGSYRLAAKIAFSLTGSRNKANETLDQYFHLMAEARTIDAQEGTPEVFVATEWTDERL